MTLSRHTSRTLVAALALALLTGATPSAGSVTALASRADSSVTSVWTEPEAGYGFLTTAIDQAQHSIDLSMYELSDASMEEALIGRARSRVDVEVLLDAAYSGASVNAAAAALLAKGGVHVRWAPTGQIFHAKYVLIDAHTAFIGTGNLVASDYSTTRDFWVADDSAHDVAAIAATFGADFAGHDTSGVAAGGLVWSPGSTSALVELISSAKASLLVENEEMDSSAIEAALVAASGRGVDVEVAMTRDSSWTAALDKLASAGVHVRDLGSSQLYIHAKVICADCTSSSGTVFIGSENFSTSSLSYNRELGLVTSTLAAIRAVRTAVTADFANGSPVTAVATTAPGPSSPGSSGTGTAVSITSFEYSIAPGAEDFLAAHSPRPGDACTLSVRLPRGYASESKGLGSAVADAKGNVAWQWEIGPSTGAGTATASLSCGAGSIERSFTIS
jgi:cardiolipin synthase A/B